jgi:tRNA (guanine-N7-)-methyltransferase
MLGVLEAFAQEGRLQNVAGLGQFAAVPSYRPLTKYERRSERLGHGVWDLMFSCHPEGVAGRKPG